MKIDILTLFPEMFEGPFGTSMLKKAQDNKLVEINIHNLRTWTKDKHKTIDDRPYGGGPGMVLMIEPIDRALKELKSKVKGPRPRLAKRGGQRSKVILLSAKGGRYTQQKAQMLVKNEHLILIAGHYEGVDHRVHEHLVDDVISIGDYVLTGGELPTMVLVDSIVRLIPGLLNPESLKTESFSQITNHQLPTTIIEYPQYTRPENYHRWNVPEVLLSGDHAEIEKWRKKKALERTNRKRPDLQRGRTS